MKQFVPYIAVIVTAIAIIAVVPNVFADAGEIGRSLLAVPLLFAVVVVACASAVAIACAIVLVLFTLVEAIKFIWRRVMVNCVV